MEKYLFICENGDDFYKFSIMMRGLHSNSKIREIKGKMDIYSINNSKVVLR